jgi:RimJ/RimL family protein N-acetyltransferase
MAEVKLRQIIEADLPDYVRWFNDPEVTQFLAIESGSITLEGEREWLAKISAPDYTGRVWAIEAAGHHIGNCSLHPDAGQPVAGFGIAVGDKSAWGKGCGTAALREVLRIGFEEMCLRRVYLTAFVENLRAIRCYEKCGFCHEGVERQARLKRGKWLDLVRMAILREEWEAMQADSSNGLCSLGPEHVNEVLTVWSEAGLWPHAGEERSDIAAALSRNREFAFGWRDSGRLVATAVGKFDGFRGWIARVGVLPAYRRQGIASKLVKVVEKRLSAAGAPQINIMVLHDNDPARALYEGQGYEESDCMIMRKRLKTGLRPTGN